MNAPWRMRLIFGPARIEANTDGSTRDYNIDPTPGGRFCKGVLYQIKVLASSGSTFRLGLNLKHGPDETVNALHSSILTTANPGTSLPAVLSGDSINAGGTAVLGEWLHPILKANSSDASTAWGVVEVYELRKPF